MIATTITAHPGHPDYLFNSEKMDMLTSPGGPAYAKQDRVTYRKESSRQNEPYEKSPRLAVVAKCKMVGAQSSAPAFWVMKMRVKSRAQTTATVTD